MHKNHPNIYRDGEMGRALRTVAPRDAINVIQPLYVYSNKKLNKLRRNYQPK
jgi:hypothetical protein